MNSVSDEIQYYSDTIEPVFRTSKKQVFLVMIEAKPKPDSDEAKEFGGAFCNCWVNADDLRTAERSAVLMMEQDNWIPHRFDEWSLVDREFYRNWKPLNEGDIDVSGFVDQALIDGEVLVNHTFPIDDPENDESE